MFNIPTVDLVATGKNIEKLRKEAGLSVKELQNIFGFGTPQAIYKWQHGTALPTVDNLVLLSAIFKVSIDEILVVEQCGGIVLSASA
ncbi:MAG: helix-turn-helix transcriptional regulator [Lachnospiraceae bacterium]|nr:helix-turn-helix transcriptional regulator [Lachnospiraceae bacterium]